MSEIKFVIVGNFTPTEVTPGLSKNEQAFGFKTRNDAEHWLEQPLALWYPDARIIELENT